MYVKNTLTTHKCAIDIYLPAATEDNDRGSTPKRIKTQRDSILETSSSRRRATSPPALVVGTGKGIREALNTVDDAFKQAIPSHLNKVMRSSSTTDNHEQVHELQKQVRALQEELDAANSSRRELGIQVAKARKEAEAWRREAEKNLSDGTDRRFQLIPQFDSRLTTTPARSVRVARDLKRSGENSMSDPITEADLDRLAAKSEILVKIIEIEDALDSAK